MEQRWMMIPSSLVSGVAQTKTCWADGAVYFVSQRQLSRWYNRSKLSLTQNRERPATTTKTPHSRRKWAGLERFPDYPPRDNMQN